MTIHQIDEARVRKLIRRSFSAEVQTLLLEHAVFTHCYAVQFVHEELELFIALAKSVEHYFSSSVTVSLFEFSCEQSDCEAVEDCLTRRSSFHETIVAENRENRGVITVIAAAVVSDQMHAMDYFTHLLGD